MSRMDISIYENCKEEVELKENDGYVENYTTSKKCAPRKQSKKKEASECKINPYISTNRIAFDEYKIFKVI
jgi:hypothetical protein